MRVGPASILIAFLSAQMLQATEPGSTPPSLKICAATAALLAESHSKRQHVIETGKGFEEFYLSLAKDLSLEALTHLADVARKEPSLESFFSLPESLSNEIASQDLNALFKDLDLSEGSGISQILSKGDLLKSLRHSLTKLIRVKSFQEQSMGNGYPHLIELDPPAFRFAVSPNGKYMAYRSALSQDFYLAEVASRQNLGAFEDAPIVQHDHRIRSLSGGRGGEKPALGFYVDHFVFSHDSKYLFGWGISENFLSVWDVKTRKHLAELDINTINVPGIGRPFHGQVQGLYLKSPTELSIIYADLEVGQDSPGHVVDLQWKDGKLSLAPQPRFVSFTGEGKGGFEDISFSKDNKTFALLVNTREGYFNDTPPVSEVQIFNNSALVSKLKLKQKAVNIFALNENTFIVIGQSGILFLNRKGDNVTFEKEIPYGEESGDIINLGKISADQSQIVVGTRSGKRGLINIAAKSLSWANDDKLPPFFRHMDFPYSTRGGIHSVSITDNGHVLTGSDRDLVVMTESLASFGQLASSFVSRSRKPGAALKLISPPLITNEEIHELVTKVFLFPSDIDEAMKKLPLIAPNLLGELSSRIREQDIGFGFGKGSFSYPKSDAAYFDLDEPYASSFRIAHGQENSFFVMLHEARHSVRTAQHTMLLKKRVGTFEIEDPQYVTNAEKDLLRARLRLFVQMKEAFAYEFMIIVSENLRKRGIKDFNDGVPPEFKEAYQNGGGLNGLIKYMTEMPQQNFEAHLPFVYSAFKRAFGVDLNSED